MKHTINRRCKDVDHSLTFSNPKNTIISHLKLAIEILLRSSNTLLENWAQRNLMKGTALEKNNPKYQYSLGAEVSSSAERTSESWSSFKFTMSQQCPCS